MVRRDVGDNSAGEGALDRDFAAELVELNNDFYRRVATSFSSTRQAPWPGWRRVFDAVAAQAGDPAVPFRILDLACGNMRFERFFQEAWREQGHERPPEFHAVDACRDLAAEATGHANTIDNLRFYELDILAVLMDGSQPAPLAVPPCDLVACFGFMHHVPSRDLRLRVLDLLAASAKPGGLIAVSFWAFMNDPRMQAKVAEAEARAQVNQPFATYDPTQLDPGDHLLGWQQDESVYRYCHHFSDAEIDNLLAAHNANSPVHLRKVDRFDADGRTQDLNRYVLLRRVE